MENRTNPTNDKLTTIPTASKPCNLVLVHNTFFIQLFLLLLFPKKKLATNILGLATTSGNLGARCLLEKKVKFVPCRAELSRITPLIPINQKIMKYFVYLMHGSILLVTMPPPPSLRTPSGICRFFLSWRSTPHPQAHRKRQFPTPELQIDLTYVFLLHLFYLYKSTTTRFHNL